MTVESSQLKAGDWVEVRSKEEILHTLDKDGCLEGMPFMPEMFAFCGKRFQVYKRAHKTCDTVYPVRGRKVEHAVHLDTRCNGSAHGGCQATCLLFWKDAWLKPAAENVVSANSETSSLLVFPNPAPGAQGCTESNVWNRTVDSNDQGAEPIYVCQATRLPHALQQFELVGCSAVCRRLSLRERGTLEADLRYRLLCVPRPVKDQWQSGPANAAGLR